MNTRKVVVTVEFTVDLPADDKTREEMYGSTDPGACIEIDLENDPAACLMDWGMEITGWRWE